MKVYAAMEEVGGGTREGLKSVMEELPMIHARDVHAAMDTGIVLANGRHIREIRDRSVTVHKF